MAVPVIVTLVIDLTMGWTPAIDLSGAVFMVRRFETPPSQGSRHYRVAMDGNAWLNGVKLDGEDAPLAARWNTLAVVGTPPAKAALIVTPRVYIADCHLRWEGVVLVTELQVRNTLDNTVNAYLSVAGTTLRATETVPPGMTQTAILRGTVELAGERLVTLVLEKESEATEGVWRHEVVKSLPLSGAVSPVR